MKAPVFLNTLFVSTKPYTIAPTRAGTTTSVAAITRAPHRRRAKERIIQPSNHRAPPAPAPGGSFGDPGPTRPRERGVSAAVALQAARQHRRLSSPPQDGWHSVL